jgi:hypothetical protein
MGINPQNKWQPYDNYVAKEGHNCAARPKPSLTPNTAGGISAQDIEAISSAVLALVIPAIQKELTTITQGVSMNNWLTEKVAKKVGVEDLIDDTTKQ